MSRTPDYHVMVMDKVRDRKSGKLGAAWDNPDGSISIQLDPGVTLPYNPDFEIRLFMNKKTKEAKTGPTANNPFPEDKQ